MPTLLATYFGTGSVDHLVVGGDIRVTLAIESTEEAWQMANSPSTLLPSNGQAVAVSRRRGWSVIDVATRICAEKQ